MVHIGTTTLVRFRLERRKYRSCIYLYLLYVRALQTHLEHNHEFLSVGNLNVSGLNVT